MLASERRAVESTIPVPSGKWSGLHVPVQDYACGMHQWRRSCFLSGARRKPISLGLSREQGNAIPM